MYIYVNIIWGTDCVFGKSCYQYVHKTIHLGEMNFAKFSMEFYEYGIHARYIFVHARDYIHTRLHTYTYTHTFTHTDKYQNEEKNTHLKNE